MIPCEKHKRFVWNCAGCKGVSAAAPDMKWCPKCKSAVHVSGFAKGSLACGLSCYCKKCMNAHYAAGGLERFNRTRKKRLHYNKASDTISHAKSRAKKAGLPFDGLDIEELAKVFEGRPLCEVCKRVLRIDYGHGMQMPDSVSLDKICPSRGYVKGNIALLCAECNVMKGRITDPRRFEMMAAWITCQQERGAFASVSPDFALPSTQPLPQPACLLLTA